ncbi:hypothetical protein APUTEX25_001847, partial [Auxenochlorella protothecoides]
RFEAVVESIADVATYHQVAQEPSKVEALRRAVHQLAQGEFEAAGVKAKLRDVAYRLPANPDLLKHLSTELQPPTSSEGLDDDIEVEDGNTLALNNICPLSGRQLMDLKRPVQDRIGVVYEEEAVLRYLYDQGGFAKEALCPLAGGQRAGSRLWQFVGLVAALIAARFLLYTYFFQTPSTLVVYVAGYEDPENFVNVNFFLTQGIREGDGAHYVIAVEPDYYLEIMELFPAKLPSNVQIVRVGLRCYNFGTVGWVLQNAGLDLTRFKYFVWLDSSVRGPFLPVYASQKPWHAQLTGLITQETKLVGATISCAGIKLNIEHPTLHVPHVQGYLQATDHVGLKILQGTPFASGVFSCHQNWLVGVRWSEVGASEAVLRAGFNIGSLMLRYAGVDWRDEGVWTCNRGMNPLLDRGYDGANAHPLEVMFVKVQHHQVVTRSPAVVPALQYHVWRLENRTAGARDVARNAFHDMAGVHLAGITAKGPACFDAEMYIAAAPAEYTPSQAWEHFLMFGYREGRAHRFIC